MSKTSRYSRGAAALALMMAALTFPLADESSGHSASTHFPHRWTSPECGKYCVTIGFTPSVPAGAWRDRVNNAAYTWWSQGRSVRYFIGPDYAAFSPYVCPTAYGKNGVHLDYLKSKNSSGVWAPSGPGGVLAWNRRCRTTSGTIKSQNLLFDKSESWYTGTATTIPSNQFDLIGVATHELGHGLGFAHFLNSDPICGGTAPATMCPKVGSGAHSVGWRSLEEHDRHTFAAAY